METEGILALNTRKKTERQEKVAQAVTIMNMPGWGYSKAGKGTK